MIPREGLPAGEKFGVADSAYMRASDELKSMLYLPTKLPENGENLQVFSWSCFLRKTRLTRAQNEELRASHRVQSHRGLIERMFARLKKWAVLSGGGIDSIDRKEMELDCAMALQNLIELARLGQLGTIPARGKFSVNAHIITRDLEPKMSIPKSLPLDSEKMPGQVVQFHSALASIYPAIKKQVLSVKGSVIFTPRLMKRGENLFLGGNVLQFMVQDEGLDVWRVRISVAASMKFPTYKCFVLLSRDAGLKDQVCECKNGYVSRNTTRGCFGREFQFFIFVSQKCCYLLPCQCWTADADPLVRKP